jgi:DNA-directed RNA polymerase specialized sigma24 family protein
MTDRERLLDELRPVAFAIAYRMLGSVSEAEDVVQEARLRVHQALLPASRSHRRARSSPRPRPRWRSTSCAPRAPAASATSATGCRSRSSPDGHDDPARHAETADSLSLALLVLLESLSPEQRAVLLLHDVFDYGYSELPEIVGKTEDNVRQLATRADATSSSAGPASKPRASSATSWQHGSSRPPSKAISLSSRRCSLTRWS